MNRRSARRSPSVRRDSRAPLSRSTPACLAGDVAMWSSPPDFLPQGTQLGTRSRAAFAWAAILGAEGAGDRVPRGGSDNPPHKRVAARVERRRIEAVSVPRSAAGKGNFPQYASFSPFGSKGFTFDQLGTPTP